MKVAVICALGGIVLLVASCSWGLLRRRKQKISGPIIGGWIQLNISIGLIIRKRAIHIIIIHKTVTRKITIRKIITRKIDLIIRSVHHAIRIIRPFKMALAFNIRRQRPLPITRKVIAG